MARIYGRVNDSNFLEEASCKKVSTCMNLFAIFYEFTALKFQFYCYWEF